MAATMQCTAASTDVRLRDQICRLARVARRPSAIKPVASNARTRLTKALALALAVMAGIAVAPRSAAADETSNASRQTSAVAIASRPGAAQRLRISAHRTDSDPATEFVEKLYKELMRATPP
jgi:hypothetical protein